MATPAKPSRRRIAKPLGVPILTAFDGVFIGLVPLILLIVLDRDSTMQISQMDYYLSTFLRIVVVAAALAAFMGENLGRVVLVWAVTAISISMIVNSVNLLSSTEGSGSRGIGIFGNIPRAVLWTAVNWWYFHKKGIVDYFKQEKV